jgi:hypothetical protein
MNQKRIVIDGKVYNSVDEMPPDVRRKYEEAMRGFKEINAENIGGAVTDIRNIFADKNNNGTPDIFEGNQSINIAGQTKIIVEGRAYDSIDDLPPEYRARYEQALGALDKNRNGLPDVVEGMMNASTSPPPASPIVNIESPAIPRRSSPFSTTPVISPERSSGWILAIGIGLFLCLCAFIAFGAWYFFLR